jgi:hypothetical protein
MKKLIMAALLLAGAILQDVRALDLTPHEVALANDGPPIKRYFFQDSNGRLGFRLDDKMTASGESESAVFGFTDIKTAAMKLVKSQMKPEVLFVEKNLGLYRAAARMSLPPDAKDVRIEEEKADAISINGWTSQQFVFTYSLFSLPYRRSITFLNYSDSEQIIFDISAASSDYEKTYLRGYRVLNSLSDLSSNSPSGPT